MNSYTLLIIRIHILSFVYEFIYQGCKVGFKKVGYKKSKKTKSAPQKKKKKSKKTRSPPTKEEFIEISCAFIYFRTTGGIQCCNYC